MVFGNLGRMLAAAAGERDDLRSVGGAGDEHPSIAHDLTDVLLERLP